MIGRVFPRRTKATPTDDYAFIGYPGLFVPEDLTEVHVSVAFSWDLKLAERLADAWSRYAPVRIGGPAFNQPGGEFEPGKYLRNGYVVTSRGCPNKCWFCQVWRREDGLKELEIQDGWNVLDDNLLACSNDHVRNVFAMLKRQKTRAEFTGGFEAKRLQSWHVDLIRDLKPHQLFFAYDEELDWEPLVHAATLMEKGGCLNRTLCRVYVLIGFPGDTMNHAEYRLNRVLSLGMFPMAMLYRNARGKTEAEWRKFQRLWARPALIAVRNRERRSV